MSERKPRPLTPQEIEYWTKEVKPSDITLEFLRKNFARYKDKPKLCHQQDTFILKAKTLNNEKDEFTTLGRYIVNLFLSEKVKFPYINQPINGKVFGKLNQLLCTWMLEDKLDTDTYTDFMNRFVWFSLSTAAFMCPSMGVDSITCPPKTEKLKKQLLEEHSSEIAAGNVDVMIDIEKQLIASAKEEYKDRDFADCYAAGGPKWEVHFKNMGLIRGSVWNPETKSFDNCIGNLNEGTPIDEMVPGANTLLAGAGGRALQTRLGGYVSKQMTAAFQTIQLDKPGSDCGSTEYNTFVLEPNLADKFLYRYIKDGNKLVLLTSENISKYVGQKINMRSPMYCHSPLFCSKCYGELPYKLGIKNIGLTYNSIGEILKNVSMKAFHDSTVKTVKLNLNHSLSPL